MAKQKNAAPVIIKRKINVIAAGHHGGAWKVAYADFVTAMMAFFMLMWLLNATTEKQRKGLADYFHPTIPINRVSGGGNGAFGGDSIMSQNALSQSGSGGTASTAEKQNSELDPDAEKAANQVSPTSSGDIEKNLMGELKAQLLASSGESMTMNRILDHVVTRVSDEGLVVELFDLPDQPLFIEGAPSETLVIIGKVLAQALSASTNEIAVNGHLRSRPMVLRDNPIWQISADHAREMHQLLLTNGLDEGRVQRVSGFADRKALTLDPTLIRNNRLEVILLRSNP